jgi:hypothetical protein
MPNLLLIKRIILNIYIKQVLFGAKKRAARGSGSLIYYRLGYLYRGEIRYLTYKFKILDKLQLLSQNYLDQHTAPRQ